MKTNVSIKFRGPSEGVLFVRNFIILENNQALLRRHPGLEHENREFSCDERIMRLLGTIDAIDTAEPVFDSASAFLNAAIRIVTDRIAATGNWLNLVLQMKEATRMA